MVTIAPMRVSFGNNRYGGLGENDFLCQNFTTPGPKPGLIIGHPRGSNATGMFADPTWTPLYRDLAQYYHVSVSDLGGQYTWGNQAVLTAIGAIRTQLIALGAINGKVGLVPMSMSGLGMFNYARWNTANVGFVAGISPALSLADLKTVSSGTYAAEIDAAHGGSYTDAALGNQWSPHYYRTNYPADSVRTAIWYSPGDLITRPFTVTEFKTAQPLVETYQVRDAAGVAPIHEQTIIPAISGLDVGGAYDFPKVADWCIQRRVDAFI